jgi:alpha-D-xyloside xylohydrolase
LKGSVLELAHRNSQISVPFAVSSAGYGFLWHNPAIGEAVFGLNTTQWTAEACGQLDYWVTAGATPAQISANYADATGHAPEMPNFALGLWQSKLRYWNQEELMSVAREHKERELPVGVIVADYFHWPHQGDFRFDPEFFPDPAAMTSQLREMGVELMVSVWPQVAFASENYPELSRRGLLVRSERGHDAQTAFVEPAQFLDVTNPEAREFLWGKVKENYFDHGVRVFWLDEAEPEFASYDFDNYRYWRGPAAAWSNVYPFDYARAFFEGQRAAGQNQIVNLARCAWIGSQRFGTLVWSGDIHSTFDDLKRQITAGVHLGVAGIPWVTTDVGGFHGGDIADPAFHELLIRWFQFAVFCPVLRMHGDRRPFAPVAGADGRPRLRTGAPNELWSYGENVYRILTRHLRTREALRPYLGALMDEAHRRGAPVMRGLFYEFPDDPACWEAPSQFMLGSDYLVAPVVEPGARSREVYLPAGAEWTNCGDGARVEGGRWVEAAAPLDRIPVFARDQAIRLDTGANA